MHYGLLILVQGAGAGGLAGVQVLQQQLSCLGLHGEFLLALFHHGGGFFCALGDGLDVGQDQLGVDDVDVPGGVHAAVHVDDVVVLKAAHHMHDGVHLADVAEKLVSQTLAPAGPLHQAGDVHEFQRGGGVLFGMIHFGQHVQAVVGYGHYAGVRFDGAEGIVCRLRARTGDGVEQRALAHVRQANDA